MDITNGTVHSRKYDEEYAKFNYMMVGAAIGLLAVIAIVARILCICNKDTALDQIRLMAERRAAMSRLENAPKEPSIPQAKVVKKIAAGSSNSTNGQYLTRMPGEVSPESMQRQSGKLKVQPGWAGRSHLSAGTNPHSFRLRDIDSRGNPVVMEEESEEEIVADVNQDETSSMKNRPAVLPRSAEHGTVIDVVSDLHPTISTITMSTLRSQNSVTSQVETESSVKQNVTNFLHKIQTMV